MGRDSIEREKPERDLFLVLGMYGGVPNEQKLFSDGYIAEDFASSLAIQYDADVHEPESGYWRTGDGANEVFIYTLQLDEAMY